ncbi:hypothetical protein PAXINDRAFT_178578 [Paxillus involutus ATCC 200175]|nr:hypothetical protein PAXINDRAFT_178578 [Paxillus involutus ATCC 200175]
MEAYGRTFEGCGMQRDYNVTTEVGEGTFGGVHEAVQVSTGHAVALKRILMYNEKGGMPVTALRELKILKAMKHPCIVDIVDMFVVRSNDSLISVYMVFPYMDHDLAGLLGNDRNHILHRDMKAANLIITNTGSVRIADFGLARAFDPSIVLPPSSSGVDGKEKKYTNCVVTRWYRPPELLLGARQYGGEVDIWGIGGSISDVPGRKGRCKNISPRTQPYGWQSIGPETCGFLDKLLTCNPRDRITASQALDYEYFWTDPLPADPKVLPTYEPSHEFDERGRRGNFPSGPLAQHPHPLPLPEHVRPSLQHGQGYHGHFNDSEPEDGDDIPLLTPTPCLSIIRRN